jgi:bifunctional UDP-N-acetylglucosamine pyrophosphorylase/glucosamine-1-phosphate N-acetyltransferase
MLFHTLDQIRAVAPGARVAIIVGHGREQVESAVHGCDDFSSMSIEFVHQAEQKGTGHAARMAMDAPWGEARVRERAQVLVFPGDLPLLPSAIVEQMALPLGRTQAMRLLTCELANPTGYGRIVRKGNRGAVLRIVEEKDANIREKAIREVGTSIYTFNAQFLRFELQKLSNKNAQGEYYLTDLVAAAAKKKKGIDVLNWECCEDVRGVNDPWELAEAARYLNERILQKWARAGVRVLDTVNTWIDAQVELAEGVELHPAVILKGKTRIAAGAVIKAGSVIEDSQVGPNASLGPYAHLRPGSVVGAGAKIGNFVELKKAVIGEKTSVAHLSYLGDAQVGANVNIGCGFVTCNFDGRVINGERKHKTIIEDGAFVGSDCQTIAPVRIGQGAYIASGSTITDDVEAGALAIARSRQVTKPGYAQKLKG